MRVGFAGVVRAEAAFHYAFFLTQTGHSEREVLDRVTELARECRPPLPHSEIQFAVRGGRSHRHYKLRTDTIVRKLRITAEELKNPRLKNWAKRMKPKRVGRRDRLRMIGEVIASHGGELLSVRELQARLKETYGLHVSVGTLHKDRSRLCQTSTSQPKQ